MELKNRAPVPLILITLGVTFGPVVIISWRWGGGVQDGLPPCILGYIVVAVALGYFLLRFHIRGLTVTYDGITLHMLRDRKVATNEIESITLDIRPERQTRNGSRIRQYYHKILLTDGVPKIPYNTNRTLTIQDIDGILEGLIKQNKPTRSNTSL